jgi:hypothetical protein
MIGEKLFSELTRDGMIPFGIRFLALHLLDLGQTCVRKEERQLTLVVRIERCLGWDGDAGNEFGKFPLRDLWGLLEICGLGLLARRRQLAELEGVIQSTSGVVVGEECNDAPAEGASEENQNRSEDCFQAGEWKGSRERGSKAGEPFGRSNPAISNRPPVYLQDPSRAAYSPALLKCLLPISLLRPTARR